MIIIGEKINGTRKKVAHAIKNRDIAFIEKLAVDQVEAGANYLDVNAGTHPSQEPQDIKWLVETIQNITDTKLCLDSANPKALLAGIRAAHRRPMINSLSGEKTRIEGVLPLACEHGTELILLALDDNGIPKTADHRLEIVRHLVSLTRNGGIPDEKLYIDPLITTIATDNNSGLIAFETIRQIRNEFPEAHITCGLSNISFGQPSRTLINQIFAAFAIEAGMDSAIIDPLESGLRNAIFSAELVLGRDPDCLKYNQAHRLGLIGKTNLTDVERKEMIVQAFHELSSALMNAGIIKKTGISQKTPDIKIETNKNKNQKENVLNDFFTSLVDMKKSRVMELTNELLANGTDPLIILDTAKKAMGEVGRLFEQGEYFVPELILSGKMLKDISTLIKPHLKTEKDPDEKKGRVIIGTVEGDIHDIGKDIVVTMLEVNGYDVMDLGVDVPVSQFVEAAKTFKPHVIGLSGFLTLAYDPMKNTIAAVKQNCMDDIKFMLGGGQIDEQVQVYTGADAFGRDALEAIKLCDKWIDI